MCRWEFIDFDIAVCRLCGEEHKCGSECDHGVSVDDGVICDITGVYVRSHSYAYSEYTDTVNVYNFDIASSCQIEQRLSHIEQYICELLLSSDARRIAYLQRKRNIDKYHQETLRQLKSNLASNKLFTWLDIIEKGVTQYQTPIFNEKHRQHLAAKCLQHLQRIICVVTVHLGLRIKDSELRTQVVS